MEYSRRTLAGRDDVFMKHRGSIHANFSALAATIPDRTALVDGDRLISYRDLDLRSDRLARHLGQLGVVHGDRVGVFTRRSDNKPPVRR